MEKINLRPVPNQSLSCTLGGKVFDITVQLGQSGSTLLSAAVDGVVQFTSQRSVQGAQMMSPPRDQMHGNLVWVCDDGASYPVYQNFGTIHNLYWWTD